MNLRNRIIPVTSPYGVWDYAQLIGATVRIKSVSVSSGLFGFDSDQEHTIEDIGIRLNRFGKAYTSIKLKGIEKEFVWKDLEITKVQYWLWNPAICGIPCCGTSICGYKSELNLGNEEGDECGCQHEGIVLDPGAITEYPKDEEPDKPTVDENNCNCCKNDGLVLDLL